jgi:hypothetical protein
MANEGIRAAIRELQDKLDQQLRVATDTKKLINGLLVSINEPPAYPEDVVQTTSALTIKPDQFFRKSITAAAHEYLKARGGAATVEEIISALQAGGCDLGSSPLRNVKISLSKNSKIFAQVGDDVFGLWDFYGGTPRVSLNRKPEPGSVAAEEAQLSGADTGVIEPG